MSRLPPFDVNEGDPQNIALLVDTSTTWGRRVCTGVLLYARQYTNWTVFVEARGIEQEVRLPKDWRGQGVIARITSPEIANALSKLNVPVINVSGIQLPESPFPVVTTDMETVVRMAFEHFHDRGFRSYGYFSLRGVNYVQNQRNAFVRITTKAGYPCKIYELCSQYGTEPDWNEDISAIASWLREVEKPIAILVWNSSCARAILVAARFAGLMTPEEVSVLSAADDDILCEYFTPPISGVIINAQAIGHAAAELLAELLRGQTIPVEPRLIPSLGIEARQSTDTLAITDPALVRALSFIRRNAGNPIQVTDVCRASGLSRRAMERHFAALLGRTPADEIRRCHLDKAKNLLGTTLMTIPDVADASGFGSPEYFAYYFKQQTGQTPLQFRRQNTWQPYSPEPR